MIIGASCPPLLRRLTPAFLALLALVSPVAGSLTAAAPLKVAVIDAPPFGMKGPDGRPAGAAVDMAVELGKRADVEIQAVLMPRIRIQEAMAEGQVDLAGMVASPAADAIGYRLAPTQPLSTIVLSRPGAPVGDLTALEGKTIALLRSANYDARITQNPAIHKQEVSSYANGINMLMAERVDALIGPDMGLYFEASQMGLSRASFAPPLIVSTLDVWLYLSRKSAGMDSLAQLKSAAESLVTDGFVETSMKAYIR